MSGYPVQQSRRFPPWLILLTAGAAGYGGWKYYTYHKFPQEVAAQLKEGLMAEINGAGFRKPDYHKALHSYIQALRVADSLEMDPLSDEYTGVLLKVAEMYHRLGLTNEAVNLYMELGLSYMSALLAGEVDATNREAVIRRDLMVATAISVYMNERDPTHAKMVVLPHVALAQRELALKSPIIASLMARGPSTDSVIYSDFEAGNLPIKSELTITAPSFGNEIFSLRDALTGYEIQKGDVHAALLNKLRTTELMLAMQAPPGNVLLSVCNIGALLYMYGCRELEFEARDILELDNIDTSHQRVSSAGHSSVNNLMDQNIDGLIAPNSPQTSQISAFADVPLALRSNSESQGSMAYFNAAEKQYKTVLSHVAGLNPWKRREPMVSEALTIATFGLGVIAMQKQDFQLAAEYLREARLRSKGLEVEDLVANCDGELEKLEKLTELQKQGLPTTGHQLPQMTVMFWRSEPESDPKLGIQ